VLINSKSFITTKGDNKGVQMKNMRNQLGSVGFYIVLIILGAGLVLSTFFQVRGWIDEGNAKFYRLQACTLIAQMMIVDLNYQQNFSQHETHLNGLGFVPSSCKYDFCNDTTKQIIIATAKSPGIDRDKSEDKISINQQGEIVVLVDDLANY